jgi:hypothetical protein
VGIWEKGRERPRSTKASRVSPPAKAGIKRLTRRCDNTGDDSGQTHLCPALSMGPPSGTWAIFDLYPMLPRPVVRLSNGLVLDRSWSNSGAPIPPTRFRLGSPGQPSLSLLRRAREKKNCPGNRESRRASPQGHLSSDETEVILEMVLLVRSSGASLASHGTALYYAIPGIRPGPA